GAAAGPPARPPPPERRTPGTAARRDAGRRVRVAARDPDAPAPSAPVVGNLRSGRLTRRPAVSGAATRRPACWPTWRSAGPVVDPAGVVIGPGRACGPVTAVRD